MDELVRADPRTLFESSGRDYVFSEVWSRPGLDRRSRYLISICAAACAGGKTEMSAYIRGALEHSELSLTELRETALQLAVYAGWSRGDALDFAVTAAADELGRARASFTRIRERSWSAEQRIAEGREKFTATMTLPAPRPVTAFFEIGILNFVFGEVWTRPGLDRRSRRWVTLVGVADSATPIAIRAYTYAALASGDITADEMNEFVLQFAIHRGAHQAAEMQAAVAEMSERVSQHLPFQ